MNPIPIPARFGRAQALALACASALIGCGGGSGGDTATTDPAATARKSAHTLDQLQDQGRRAARHHTVFTTLRHPASREQASVRSIPYHFDTATTQSVCIRSVAPTGHRVEIVAVGGSGAPLAVIDDQHPCQTVRFEPGDYDAVVVHGGSGATDAVTNVFAHAGFAPTSAQSAFGQHLAALEAARASATPAGRDGLKQRAAFEPACRMIETIALKDKGSGSYFSTAMQAKRVAPFELRKTAQNALIIPSAAVTTVPIDTFPPADDTLLDVWACGDKLKFQAHGGLFLQSQCGYPLFAADTVEDATAYISHWDPVTQRLDLQNADTMALLVGTPRGKGIIALGFTLRPPATQVSIGTCTDYPAALATGRDDNAWVQVTTDLGGVLPIGKRPQPRETSAWQNGDQTRVNALMVAEFAYRTIDRFELPVQGARLVREPGGRRYMEQTYLYGQDFDRYETGAGNLRAYTYPADLALSHGFVPSRQEVLVFAFGSCENCDLTGLDLSNQTLAELDVKGSTLTDANFKGAHIKNATFENAAINGTDFTDANLESVTFLNGTLGVSATTKRATTFDHTTLGSPGFVANFQGATLDGVVLNALDLSATLWNQAVIRNLVITDVKLNGAVFDGAQLANVDIPFAQAGSASFKSATLNAVQLTYANLAGANFDQAQFTGSSFDYAYAVGTRFTNTHWTNASFNNAQAYSSGAANQTAFDHCTIDSGSFTNSLFMQSSFDNCKFQGGSFSGSNFVAASFKNATSSRDQTDSQLSFATALLAGADFDNASFDTGDLTNATVSTQAGSASIRIQTSPYVSASQPGTAVKRSYNYAATTKPTTTAGVTCPNALPGPCTEAASWLPVTPPVYQGVENPNAW